MHITVVLEPVLHLEAPSTTCRKTEPIYLAQLIGAKGAHELDHIINLDHEEHIPFIRKQARLWEQKYKWEARDKDRQHKVDMDHADDNAKAQRSKDAQAAKAQKMASVVELTREQFTSVKDKMLKAELENQMKLHQLQGRKLGGKKITYSGKKKAQLVGELELILAEL